MTSWSGTTARPATPTAESRRSPFESRLLVWTARGPWSRSSIGGLRTLPRVPRWPSRASGCHVARQSRVVSSLVGPSGTGSPNRIQARLGRGGRPIAADRTPSVHHWKNLVFEISNLDYRAKFIAKNGAILPLTHETNPLAH